MTMLQAFVQGLQVYGIAIFVSFLVAIIIKILVKLTSNIGVKKEEVKAPAAVQQAQKPVTSGVPEEVVAAIAAAVASISGPHRILHIARSGQAWAHQGRSAQHSHQPRY